MKKIRRFVVLQVTFYTNERLSMPTVFHDLRELGIEVTEVKWKSKNCLKIRAWVDPLRQIGQKQIPRREAVSAVVNKAQVYFPNAVVVATYGKDNR